MASLQGVATLLLAIIATHQTLATSRAVNISSTWFLPQEGFPVFYRYFQDRITWFEADAVCQFHHANLVTVDTSVQYDAARAYLKELDIVNNVWIGLKRSGENDEFTWTDYKALERNGGYWNEQIPKSTSPLCAATDPAADFRWHSLNCGGPEVASFICEMPVPPWAHQEDGCMLTSLPSLTVIFLPELGAVELTSDCGQDGTRRIACKGQANREEMMRQLSCDYGGLTQDDGMGSAYPDVTSSSSVTSSSHRASTGQTSREWTGTSSAESHEMSGHGNRGWTGPSSSTGAWTGHFHEPPTRHRRDASSQMISLLGSTTSALSTDVSLDEDTTVAATSSEHSPKAGTTLKLEQTESGTHTTTDESRLSTTDESWTSTVRDVDTTTTAEELSSQTEEVVSMEKIKEELGTTHNVRTPSTSEPPLSTISVLNVSADRITTTLAEEIVTSSTSAAETSVSETSSSVKPKEVLNVTEVSSSQTEQSSTTDVPAPNTVKPSPSTSTTTDSPSSTMTDDQIAGLNAQITLLEPDEIKSREEDEEERLKEEERKEEERRFREEEENRRRLFLPSPLRLAEIASETASSRAPPSPPVVEDAYEEPEEIVEPEPEMPSRPNRGRRLTRPQTHSFYPYFLNRVLG